MAGGIDSITKESIQRAFAYLNGHKVDMGIAQAFETTDFHVEPFVAARKALGLK